MKFISHIRRQQVVILTDVTVVENGQQRTIVPLYIAAFKGVRDAGGDLNAEELDFAEGIYGKQANGRNLEMDQHTFVNLMTRLSTYDTEDAQNVAEYEAIDRQMKGQEHASLERGQVWYDGYMKELVEAKLLFEAERQNHDDFTVYREPELVPPWPNYDRFPGTADDLVGVILDQGYHLPAVLAYEQQNQNRPEVTGALKIEIANQPEPVPGEFINA